MRDKISRCLIICAILASATHGRFLQAAAFAAPASLLSGQAPPLGDIRCKLSRHR
jgi:hypothetical protein